MSAATAPSTTAARPPDLPASRSTKTAPSESLSPDAEAELAEDSVLLKRLVDQLPQAQRELVKLKYEAGLSYKEMSETTRMSVSNVGVQLHAAIQTLRRLWNNERVLS